MFRILIRDRRGVGSIIGAVFLLLILLTGYVYYALQVNATYGYNRTLLEMQELDLQRSKEKIEILKVTFDAGSPNITVRNTGPYLAHLIWLGIFDVTNNAQDYYKIDFYVDAAETVTNVGNSTVPSFENDTRTIQIVTALGNMFSYSYPLSFNEKGSEYYFVDAIGGPPAIGTHGFFSAMQYGPDGIMDTLTEGKTIGISKEHYVDVFPSGTGSHTNPAAQQDGPNGVYDTLIEGTTGSLTNTTTSATTTFTTTTLSTITITTTSETTTTASGTITLTTTTPRTTYNTASTSGTATITSTTTTTSGTSTIDPFTSTTTTTNNVITTTSTSTTYSFLTTSVITSITTGTTRTSTRTTRNTFTYTINTMTTTTWCESIPFSTTNTQKQTKTTYRRTTISRTNSPTVNTFLWTSYGWATVQLPATSTTQLITTITPTTATVTFTSTTTTTSGTKTIAPFTTTTTSATTTYTTTDSSTVVTTTATGSTTDTFLVTTTTPTTTTSTATTSTTSGTSTQMYPVYQLNLEEQFTNCDYSQTNAELCIYTGELSSENLMVDVWNGSAWIMVISSLQPNNWNNVSVTSYLTGQTLRIRFWTGTDAGDTTQDSWQIDSALLHIWTSSSSYMLDLEVQWTNADYNEANEWLCIYGENINMSSEGLRVDVWNGASWVTIIPKLKSGWNSVNVSSYLTSSTFKIRFRDTIETGDTFQDSWDIDVAMLHVWT